MDPRTGVLRMYLKLVYSVECEQVLQMSVAMKSDTFYVQFWRPGARTVEKGALGNGNVLFGYEGESMIVTNFNGVEDFVNVKGILDQWVGLGRSVKDVIGMYSIYS